MRIDCEDTICGTKQRATRDGKVDGSAGEETNDKETKKRRERERG